MSTKNVILKIIRENAIKMMGRLSCELIRAQPEDKETILAEMEYQGWMSGCIHDCFASM